MVQSGHLGSFSVLPQLQVTLGDISLTLEFEQLAKLCGEGFHESSVVRPGTV